MKIRILESAAGGRHELQYASSYLVNGTVAIDAGSLGVWSSPAAQQPVTHVVLTHGHQDHIASLPYFLENVWESGHETVTVHAGRATLDTLREHVFNGRVWPDFINLFPQRPFLRLAEVEPESPFEVDGLRFLPVKVPHPVPTFGYIVTDGRATAVFGADAGPTSRIWQLAAAFPAPRAVFLEAAFPNALAGVARIAQHLTPHDFAAEVAKMPSVDHLIAVHLKPRFRDTIIEELTALALPNLTIATGGLELEF